MAGLVPAIHVPAQPARIESFPSQRGFRGSSRGKVSAVLYFGNSTTNDFCLLATSAKKRNYAVFKFAKYWISSKSNAWHDNLHGHHSPALGLIRFTSMNIPGVASSCPSGQ